MKNKGVAAVVILLMLLLATGSASGEMRGSSRPGRSAISLGVISYRGLGIEGRLKYNFYAEPIFETNNLSLELFTSLSLRDDTYFMEIGLEGEYNFTPDKNYAIYLGLGGGYTGATVGAITATFMEGFAYLSQGWEYFLSPRLSMDIKVKETFAGPETYLGGGVFFRYYW